jgi:hypothetical protein
MESGRPARSQFRLGLLLDSPIVSKYVRNFVARVQSNDNLTISAALLISPGESPPALRASLSSYLFRLIVAIERILLRKNKRHYDHFSCFDISTILPGTAIIRLADDTDQNTIGSLNVDLFIAFSEAATQNLHAAARLGTLRLTHSGELTKSGPAGYWEVYKRMDVSGFVIERITSAPRVRDVLLLGYVGTQFYYLLNQATLFEKSHYYLFKTVEKIALLSDVPKPRTDLQWSPTFPAIPSLPQSVSYLLGLAHLLAGKINENFRHFSHDWNVGYMRTGWRQTESCEVRIIENPPQHILADPFVVSQHGRTFCFAEDLDSATNRGTIVAYSINEEQATYAGVALDEDCHLSFPYVFEYRGELYMCPETSEKREIRIYKCLGFPLQWKLEKVLMKDISAVDTMLFERNGRWWMMTNTDPAQWDDHSMELRIFSATSPVDDDWRPHPGNPFMIDASRTRNGGIVLEDDKVFRVAQGQGFDMYGKRVTINEIVQLDDQIYIEQCVRSISPAIENGIAGTHHFHTNGAITIFDFAHDGAIGSQARRPKFTELVNSEAG